MKTIDLVQGSPEWLNFRENGVGASDIAAICNVPGAFKKRSEVIQEKLGNTKELSDFAQQMFDDGHEWEAAVRDAFLNGEYNFVPMVAVDEFNSRLFASLDGVDVSKKTILEIKHVRKKETFLKYSKIIPEHYMAQLQWQMMITGFSSAMIAFVHEGDVVVLDAGPDVNVAAKYRTEAEKFLSEVDAIRAGTQLEPVQNITNDKTNALYNYLLQRKELEYLLDQVNANIKDLSENLLTEFKATKIENDVLMIYTSERNGSVDYKKMCSELKIDEKTLEKYRKKGTVVQTTKLK